jgi:retron-type reverse transcriptase
MTKLERLRAAKSLSDLAKLVHFTPTGLAYVLYKMPAEMRYRVFEIPKSGGGVRTIHAPQPHLKLLQTGLADLLLDCLSEIEAKYPNRRRVTHGFQRNRSIVTNAAPHHGRRFVLNLDLQDFFGTINFGRVRGFFIADRNFQLDPTVATVIAQIACHENALPQGAPCSPVISNLVGHILDARLIRLAREFGCTYTRYVDDLTFSTNRRNFFRQLARASKIHPNRWILGKRLKDAIKISDFSVNPSKIRMQIRGSRQEITGLIVNDKVNIRQEYYRTVRSMCHSLFQTGQYYVEDITEADELAWTNELAPLEGRLAHIYYVKARRDRPQRENKFAQFEVPKAPLELYRRFLFYKYFVASDLPVIVTEGKTDIIYLKAAIRALQAYFPSLAKLDADQMELCVKFLNPTPVNQRLLNLGTGFAGMKPTIECYENWLRSYSYAPLEHPVVFVVDHDSGGEKVLKAADKVSSQDIKASSTDAFFHIRRNLYLVKTPLNAQGEWAEIEDCFPQEVLSKKVNGKQFDKKKKHGDEISFGKQFFAEKVVLPDADKIDFSGFAPILEGISKAMNDYHVNVKRAANEIAAKSA